MYCNVVLISPGGFSESLVDSVTVKVGGSTATTALQLATVRKNQFSLGQVRLGNSQDSRKLYIAEKNVVLYKIKIIVDINKV